MGDERVQSRQAAAKAPVPYRLTAEFREAPAAFDGCFTTFYHLSLDMPRDDARLTDYLQPEWGNIRFFCGTTPEGEIGGTRVSGAPFVGTGPSSLPCRFTLGPVRMWGVGFLPLGWARFFDADASSCANIICDGSGHPAFSRFAGLTDTLCDPEATLDEQYAAIVAAMTKAMRPTRDDARITRVHAALVSGDHAAVHDLADACAMSIRTLERVCMRYFGFSLEIALLGELFEAPQLMQAVLPAQLEWGSLENNQACFAWIGFVELDRQAESGLFQAIAR